MIAWWDSFQTWEQLPNHVRPPGSLCRNITRSSWTRERGVCSRGGWGCRRRVQMLCMQRISTGALDAGDKHRMLMQRISTGAGDVSLEDRCREEVEVEQLRETRCCQEWVPGIGNKTKICQDLWSPVQPWHFSFFLEICHLYWIRRGRLAYLNNGTNACSTCNGSSQLSHCPALK